MRHRLDKEGLRYGKILDFKYVAISSSSLDTPQSFTEPLEQILKLDCALQA